MDSAVAMPNRTCIAGCPVDQISLEAAEQEICGRVARRNRTHVVFVNAAKVVRYRQDTQLQAAMDRADLLLADGIPIVWASKILGRAIPGRVNGTDLMYKMFAASEKNGFRIYLLGAQDKVLRLAVNKIKEQYPRIQIAGFRDGYFSGIETSTVIRQINESRADILFIAMSTPQKELWADQHSSSLDVPICQGVGGSLDVVAGVVGRAPIWMQRSGLEWFYRLLQEPRRLWRRYLETNLVFIGLVLADRLNLRKSYRL